MVSAAVVAGQQTLVPVATLPMAVAEEAVLSLVVTAPRAAHPHMVVLVVGLVVVSIQLTPRKTRLPEVTPPLQPLVAAGPPGPLMAVPEEPGALGPTAFAV